MKKKNFQYQQGFTLTEVLVVVALIGIIVGMSIPSFIQARRYANVTQRVNELFVPLTRARNLAMRKQRPVLIIVQAPTANRLIFSALLDQDYASGVGNGGGPGWNGNLTGTTPPSTSINTDFQLLPTEDPFGSPAGMVVDPFATRNGVVNNNRQFSFGRPTAPGSSVFVAHQSNLFGATTAPAYCGGTTCWFGFDAAGKLIPNGETPFRLPTVKNVTAIAHLPAGNAGGPEFYFAEFGAATNTRVNSHVYRKIEISPIGGIRIQSWNNRTFTWRGTQ